MTLLRACDCWTVHCTHNPPRKGDVDWKKWNRLEGRFGWLWRKWYDRKNVLKGTAVK